MAELHEEEIHGQGAVDGRAIKSTKRGFMRQERNGRAGWLLGRVKISRYGQLDLDIEFYHAAVVIDYDCTALSGPVFLFFPRPWPLASTRPSTGSTLVAVNK